MFLHHPSVKVSIVWSLRDREVACLASDSQGSNFESCIWRTVSSQSYHHPQEVLLAPFSLYVHKGGLSQIQFISWRAKLSFKYIKTCKYISIRPTDKVIVGNRSNLVEKSQNSQRLRLPQYIINKTMLAGFKTFLSLCSSPATWSFLLT